MDISTPSKSSKPGPAATPAQASPGPNGGWTFDATSWLCLCTSVWIVVWAMWHCQYGFDVRDEGFYLVSMSDPFDYPLQLSLFSWVLSPLWHLLGQDMIVSRWLTLLSVYGLAFILCWQTLRRFPLIESRSRLRLLAVAAALATSSLAWLCEWRPTPNYNTLTFQSLLLATIGILIVSGAGMRARVAGWALVGVAGWMCWMAKLSTGTALALCVCIYALATRRFEVRLVLASSSIALTLLLLSAMVISGSVDAFATSILQTVELVRELKSGHTIERLIRFDPFLPSARGFGVIALGAFGTFGALHRPSHWGRWRFVELSATIFTLVAVAVIMSVVNTGQPRSHMLVVLLVWGCGLGVLVAGRPRRLYKLPRATWAFAVFVFVLPDVSALGTLGPYYLHGSGVAMFWLLSAVVLCGAVPCARSRSSGVFGLGMVAQIVVAVSLHTGIHTPPQQAHSLRTNTDEFSLRPGTIPVKLRPEHAQYFRDARQLARESGLVPGMSIIDLTGRSPGLLYALGARSAGRAWMIGSFAGSELYAASALESRSCTQLSRAWVLTEPQGFMNIPARVLAVFGANLQRDYQKVGTIESPAGIDRVQSAVTQELWRPLRPPDSADWACRAKREDVGSSHAKDALTSVLHAG